MIIPPFVWNCHTNEGIVVSYCEGRYEVDNLNQENTFFLETVHNLGRVKKLLGEGIT